MHISGIEIIKNIKDTIRILTLNIAKINPNIKNIFVRRKSHHLSLVHLKKVN